MIRDKKQIQEAMRPIRASILNMDGTIYLGNTLFPYTHDFLDTVKRSGKAYYFFTNNSSKDVKTYTDKLHSMGIDVEQRRMMTSTHVILRWLKEYHAGKRVYVVGIPALQAEFQHHGWQLDEEHPDIVVLGFDTTLTYDKLSKACHFIREGAAYYGINPDLNCPMENDTFIPNCGSMARLVEVSTGRHPEFFGKPSPKTPEYIIKETGLDTDRIAIIGDRLYADITVADHSAVTSILVMSGETKEADIEKSEAVPDIVIEDIGGLAKPLWEIACVIWLSIKGMHSIETRKESFCTDRGFSCILPLHTDTHSILFIDLSCIKAAKKRGEKPNWLYDSDFLNHDYPL